MRFLYRRFTSIFPPFLDIYNMSLIKLFVFWFTFLTSAIVNFKNGLGYFTRVFIPLMRFLLHRLILRSFLILLRQSFLIYPFISACLMMFASNISQYFCIVISFLVLWSISSFFMHFKNDPEYPHVGSAEVFILLMRFLLQIVVSRTILIRLR